MSLAWRLSLCHLFTCVSSTVSGSLSVSKPKKKTYQSEVRTVQGCSPELGSAYTQKPNLPVSNSQHEDQPSNSAHEMPILGYQYGSSDRLAPSRRLSNRSGGGGLKQCTYCSAWTANAQRICPNCRTRMINPTSAHFPAMRAAQLVRCRRVGCPNGVSSNKGLCRDCEKNQRQNTDCKGWSS